MYILHNHDSIIHKIDWHKHKGSIVFLPAQVVQYLVRPALLDCRAVEGEQVGARRAALAFRLAVMTQYHMFTTQLIYSLICGLGVYSFHVSILQTQLCI